MVNADRGATEVSKLASKLSTEKKADVIVSPFITLPSIAAMEVTGSSATPIIALGGNAVFKP